MLWTILLAAFLGYVLYIRRYIKAQPYDSIPGPRRWPLVGSVFYFIGCSDSELFEKILNMHTYGKRCAYHIFGKWRLQTSDVKDIEVILTHSKNITKGKGYNYLRPWFGDGIIMSTGKKWHSRRRLVRPAFRYEVMKNYFSTFQMYSKCLVQKLEADIQDEGGVVNVTPLLSDHTLYTICKTMMGLQTNLESSAFSQFKRSVYETGPIIIHRLTSAWLHSDFIFNNTPIGKKFNALRDINERFTDNVIDERKRQLRDKYRGTESDVEKDRLVLLDLLLEAEKKGEIDVNGIKEEAKNFIVAGYDSTAIALTFALLLLADHEDVQDKLYEECISVCGDTEHPPSIAGLADMKYLDAVCKETLRLYPSVPFLARMIEEDFMLDDILVRKDTEVVVRIYDVHRSPDLFSEPEAFKPERFFDGEPIHPFAYLPFSAGPRNCIGQKFAKLEIKCFLCEVIRNFKLQPVVRGLRPALKADVVLRPVHPVNVKFTLR